MTTRGRNSATSSGLSQVRKAQCMTGTMPKPSVMVKVMRRCRSQLGRKKSLWAWNRREAKKLSCQGCTVGQYVEKCCISYSNTRHTCM